MILPSGPLERLFERAGLPHFELPAELALAYGGGLGFGAPRLFANFVASVDGVVALPAAGESGHIISQDNLADRFVMGLLRAFADAVLIGAGTFRSAPSHLWHAERIYPDAAALFSELRRKLGLEPHPKFVLLSGSGEIDCSQPALQDAFIVTTPRGEARLSAQAPRGARLIVSDSELVSTKQIVALLRSEGFRNVLTEGGPSLVAELVKERLLDELFVTLSPALFGRERDDGKKSLLNGLDLGGVPLELMSLSRHASHLFLRYSL